MNYFIDLHTHSTFSLRDGFGTPAEIPERAVELGWGAASITEHGWLGSAPPFYKACVEKGIKPIIGCEFYVTPDWALGQQGKEFQKESYHLTVLALSKEGYQNLVAWVTESMQRENFYHKPRISIERMLEIAPHSVHHNVVLSGCLGSELCTKLAETNGNGNVGALYVDALRHVFPNFYIEVQQHAHPKFLGKGFLQYEQMVEKESFVRAKLIELSETTGVPLVLTNDSHFQKVAQRKTHIAMKANAWRHRDDTHYGKSDEQQVVGYMKDYIYFTSYLRDMEAVGDGLPQSALHSISEIVSEANLVLSPLDNFSYSIPFSGRDNPVDAIRRRVSKRLRRMLEKHGDSARVRFELELEAMGEFAHYLILMSDFVRAAKKQGILTWTRGSAANSFLCYLLGIHEIDSIEYGLVFSRFFNPARKKLPDIDVDIQPDRYEDFMRSVFEIMEPLTGKGQVQQVCNYGTAQNRSAFRSAASALGIPKEEQDEIAKLLPQMNDSDMMEEDEDIFIVLKQEYPDIYELSSSMFDSKKSVSQHACAWSFGTPEQPIEDWVPMYLIASSGKLVTQFDFKTMEDFGFVKYDFLRLKTLTVAAKVLRMIGRSPLDFHKLPLNDPQTYEMIRKGKVEGVHTIQGKEVRKGVVAMQAENVHDLILAAALFRPANTRDTDGAKTYLARRNGSEEPDYPHPLVEEVVKDTLGVPVYQEQAMEICYAVGMDDAGVDDVYQAIKKAKGAGRGAKEAFAAIEPNFMKAARKVMDKVAAFSSWKFVQGYQGYGFNKGHATSYGVLADRMAYLKCHHPAEFHTAVLDTFPDKHKYIADTKADGFKFLPPSVNTSGSAFTFDKASGGIRVGVAKIKGLGPVATKEILSGQPFKGMDDFEARTTGRGARQKNRLSVLNKIGALMPFGIRGSAKDADEVEILGFVLGKPKAFKGIKPKHCNPRVSQSGWRHVGRQKGMELSETRTSVTKLFWIPPNPKLELKSSPWAQVKTWLLTVVDESGVPFDLMVNEDKPWKVKLLKFLGEKCQDSVIAADGMVRMPFTDGPQGFRFFGIAGASRNDPQVWHLRKEKKFKKTIIAVEQMDRQGRYS